MARVPCPRLRGHAQPPLRSGWAWHPAIPSLALGLVSLACAILGGWFVVNVCAAVRGLAGLTEPRLSPPLRSPRVFVAEGLWIPWAAWMFFWPLRMPARIAVLLALAALLAGGLWLLRGDGQLGNGRANLVWAWEVPARLPAPPAPAATSSLARRATLLPPDPRPDYPQFLGPTGKRSCPRPISPATGSQRPPVLVCRASPIGAGWGAIAVAGGYALTRNNGTIRNASSATRLPRAMKSGAMPTRAAFTPTPAPAPGPRRPWRAIASTRWGPPDG